MNDFLNAVNKNNTFTENGATAHSTTGDILVDQFSKSGSYRDRCIEEVFNDQFLLHNENKELALKFVFYLRLITREIKGTTNHLGDSSLVYNSSKLQKGQGNRDEHFKRLLWYLVNHPNVFYDNLYLLPLIGSYRDIWDIIVLAVENNISIDIHSCIMGNYAPYIANYNADLFLKYLPTVKANSKTKTSRAKIRNKIAMEVANFCEMTPKELRKFKSSGKGHEWQQLISKKKFKDINYNHIPGKALLNLTTSKFLENQKLVNDYLSWIDKQTSIKFNGYPHELGKKVKYNNSLVIKHTIDKQFENLLCVVKKDGFLTDRKVITAIDRSGSMECNVANTTAMNIAESLGIYFSNLLEGDFKNWVIKFSQKSEWEQLKGTFSEQKLSMTWNDCPNNTDFQSIIDSFVRIRKDFNSIKESDFPNTLLVVSDMQFDSVNSVDTNYQLSIKKLSQVFSKEYVDNFIFIWWDVTGRVPENQPQHIDEPNGYVLSGFDGSVISLLLGSIDKLTQSSKKEKISMKESIIDILSQDILKLVKI